MACSSKLNNLNIRDTGINFYSFKYLREACQIRNASLKVNTCTNLGFKFQEGSNDDMIKNKAGIKLFLKKIFFSKRYLKYEFDFYGRGERIIEYPDNIWWNPDDRFESVIGNITRNKILYHTVCCIIPKSAYTDQIKNTRILFDFISTK